MGKVTGFIEIARADPDVLPVSERVAHYHEFTVAPASSALQAQGARCMDCGIPYCHTGCPVNNVIPDWNDLVYRGDWRRAIEVLHSTNNFPEFTGRICPAPCEEACTLNFNDSPVAIKSIECAIIDAAWREGWVTPQPPTESLDCTVAVIGSGPAGLACAQQLARRGYRVTVYEKNERAGGLLRFGIPDFKMEKHLIDRRIEQMEQEGVCFKYGVEVGVDIDAASLREEYDVLALTGGCEAPRDLPIEGRQLGGVHFALEFLGQQNRRVADIAFDDPDIFATEKNVVVIGGGDTGSDCIGTSNRHRAKNIVQLELMPQPPTHEDKMTTWPRWPLKLRTSSSHEEGCDRQFSIATKRFSAAKDDPSRVGQLHAIELEWVSIDGRMQMQEVPGSEFVIPADLVLLAMGYLAPVYDGLLAQLSVERTPTGHVLANTRDYRTSLANVYSAGDMRRGQSLVVWAIAEGRGCADAIHRDRLAAVTA